MQTALYIRVSPGRPVEKERLVDIPASSSDIRESKNNLLNRLHVLYTKKSLPSEFTGDINFARIKTLVKNTYLSGTKTD